MASGAGGLGVGTGVKDVEIFKNNRVFATVVSMVGVLMMFLGLVLEVAGVYKLFHTPESAAKQAGSIAILTLGVTVVLLLSLLVWSVGRSMKFYQVSFEPGGARFRLGDEKKPQVTYFAWNEITGVYFKRGYNMQYGMSKRADGSKLDISSYTFFRVKKLMKMIAERSGQEMQTVN
jgi:hypothetical protein